MKKMILFSLVSLLTFFSCQKNDSDDLIKQVDAVLIGGGIMSASVASLLHEMDPELSIVVYERLSKLAQESSLASNNAGTGHAAYCELNYTPELEDGSIDISKALRINESFEISKQFWAYQAKNNILHNPSDFIRNVPHMSFVEGEDNIKYLKKRFEALKNHPLFKGMKYSENPVQVAAWAPLLMEGRNSKQKIAATRVRGGTDVDFGALTLALFDGLTKNANSEINVNHEVYDFSRKQDGSWRVFVKDLVNKETKTIDSKFIFIGAGGGTLDLLQKTNIPEAKVYAGFPVGGQWLVSDNPSIVDRHMAKVYGQASVGAPPMSVPHLDTRFIDGKRSILFGPFAVFSTKFLKHGSWLDILASFRWHNTWPMIQAGIKNIPLTRYLIEQVLLSHEERVISLRKFFPRAELKDWRLQTAGQRVQIIKKDPEKGGIIQFGTEVVSAQDGSIVALLGASPGASIAVKIALEVLEKGFAKQMTQASWANKLQQMIPSYKKSLANDPELLKAVRQRNRQYLGLEH